MTNPEKTDKELRALRTQVHELERRWDFLARESRFGAVAAALAGGLLALTAATWTVNVPGDDPLTLWQLSQEGWFGFVTLILVLGFALATFVTIPSASKQATQIALCVVGVLASIGVLLVQSPAGYSRMPAQWVAILLTITLTGLHIGRLSDA